MKKVILLLALFFPILFFAQNARDINTVIQKTLELEVLKDRYHKAEIEGETPLIIVNDDKIPNNLIVYMFDKRVKLMTPEQLEKFQKTINDLFLQVYNGNEDNVKENSWLKKMDSYFFFEEMKFKDDIVSVKAVFRKSNKIKISVSMKKQGKDWIVTESSAG